MRSDPRYPGINPDDPRDKRNDRLDLRNLFKDAHKYADTDVERSSIHHTLGAGPTQAAPGNHTHFTDDTGWILVTLSNGWINYGDIWESVAYRRMNGVVYLRGLIKSGTAVGGTVLFNLPEGFRPASNSHVSVPSNGAHGIINVYSDGRVTFNTGSNSWFSLSDVSFPVASIIGAPSVPQITEDTGWLAFPGANGAAFYSGVSANGGEYENARYRVFTYASHKEVRFKGMLQNNNGFAVGSGWVFGVLPLGHRPVETAILDSIALDVHCRVDFRNNGNITYYSGPSLPSMGGWLSISNLSFIIDSVT